MLDGYGYPVAWLVYLISSLGLMRVFWRMTVSLPSNDIKKVSRGFVIALLLTPVDIGQSGFWFAPAWLVSSYEWIQGNIDVAVRAGLYLLGAFLVIVLLLALEAVIHRLLHMD
jgi:hypothetical protein